MRFLLVEDDPMIGDTLRAALRMEGHAVDWVRDAAAAQSTLASERFDLLLAQGTLWRMRGDAPREQELRIRFMKQQMQAILGDRADQATGFRAPTESYDANTEILLGCDGMLDRSAPTTITRSNRPPAAMTSAGNRSSSTGSAARRRPSARCEGRGPRFTTARPSAISGAGWRRPRPNVRND